MEKEIQEQLKSLFNKLTKEFDGLKNGSYDKDKLQGYKDCLWDLSLFLKEDHGITVKLTTHA